MINPCLSRWFYVGELLITTGLLAFAFFLQRYQGLPPCALCELQRIVFLMLTFLFLIGSAVQFRRGGQIGLNVIIALVSLCGIILAGRQVWLQYHPPLPGSGSCDASLSYLFQILSWTEVITTVFIGGSECAKIGWQLWHFNISQWSLIWFGIFFLLAWWQLLGYYRLGLVKK